MIKVYVQKVTKCDECPACYKAPYWEFVCVKCPIPNGYRKIENVSQIPIWCPLIEYKGGDHNGSNWC